MKNNIKAGIIMSADTVDVMDEDVVILERLGASYETEH